MKEEKTKKRKVLYYLVLAISVCLLTAATVLTVYFVAGNGADSLQATPPGITTNTPDEGKTDVDNKPASGTEEKFCSPVVAYNDASVFNDIYASKTTGFIYRHQGVDFAAAAGTKVAAIADGTVERISISERNGNLITVNHGGGLIASYKFVEPVSSLKKGSKITKGQYFATVAEAYGSEAKDGTHLHLELYMNGKAADPAAYLNIQYAEK